MEMDGKRLENGWKMDGKWMENGWKMALCCYPGLSNPPSST